MPGKPLGRHVLVTIPPGPRNPNDAWRPAPQHEWTVTEGCLAVPAPVPLEQVVGNRQTETAQWNLYLPAGYRATGDARCQVLTEGGAPFVPDPTDPAAPARLEFAYTPRPVVKRNGVERYVEAVARLVTTAQSPRR